MAPPSDEHLAADVAEAAAGSVAAFERIYARLSPSIASYLRWNGASDVEALTNEVLAQVHRNLGRFAGDGAAFRSWVFTIAHRRLLDERRGRGRRPPMTSLSAVPEAMDLPSPDDVESIVDRAQRVEWVRSLCDQVSPEQRDVLLLRLVARLTIDEVAAALGKSSVAVKALQRRGFRAIARILDREEVPL
jgi:RNA polymerase sigma factor (sigma-70 family)